ncbi:MAG: LEA type 2 family protein [Anaeromyxobacter sp.]
MRIAPVRLAAAALALATLAGCAGLKDLAAAAFTKPKLDFKGAVVEGLDLEGATIGLQVDLTNPNGFGLDVARVGWTLDAENTRVATGDMPGGLAIPAKGTAPLTIPVRLRWKDVPGILNLFTSRHADGLGYKAAATVGVNTPIGVVELPVSHAGTVKLPALPAFSIQGVSVKGVSLSEVTFDVKVGVKNPNMFSIPAGKLGWSLALGGGAPVARAENAPLAGVAAGQTGTIDIPLKLDFRSAGRAAMDVARGGDVRVQMKGTADVAGLPIPLDLDTTVPARR